MTGLHFTQHTFTSLTVLIVLSFAFVLHIDAEEEYATLSGRVVSSEGKPIVDATMMLQISTTQTDPEGRFVFTKIGPSQTRLRLLRHPTTKNGLSQPSHTTIQAIKFGSVIFYPHDFHDSSKSATFAIEPGTDIKNVEVTINTGPKLRIQGRLVFKNGEPFDDTPVEINMEHLNLDGTDGSAFKRSLHTDADGNFVSAIYVPGIYALSVDYRGLSAMSAPFIVEADKPHEPVVLTLNGTPADLSAPFEIAKEQRYGMPEGPGVWIINPANGHAYKWIKCDGREDAQAQAALEEAHLVTITNEAEQIWLESVFSRGPYWIGLTDVAKEGEWQWETGEPFAYTNWKVDDQDDWSIDEPPAFLKFLGFKNEDRLRQEDERDFVVMSHWGWDAEIGKWEAADHSKAARMAILEKDGM